MIFILQNQHSSIFAPCITFVRCLTEEISNCVASCLVQSRLDYANSLHTGMSSTNCYGFKTDSRTYLRYRNKEIPFQLFSSGFTGFRFANALISLRIYKIRQSVELEHLIHYCLTIFSTRNLRSSLPKERISSYLG